MEQMSRRNRKTLETKEKIMAAAQALFARDGFQAVTFRSLAAESGISFGSIQHHFGTKDNLMHVYGCRVFEVFLEEYLAEHPVDLAEDSRQQSLIKKVNVYYTAYAAFARKMGKDFILEASRNGHDIFEDVCYRRYIVPIMEEGYASNAFSTPKERRYMLNEDLRILCRSIVLLWSSSGDTWEYSGELEDVLGRVLRRFLHDKNSEY